jgi:folate-binding protein YgfZ
MPSPLPELDAISPGLKALLTTAAFAPIDNLGWIRVTGSDRVRWLNGMVTNNIAALQPGHGCYNFFLNAQGRIQGDGTAFLLEDSILLQTAKDRIPALIALLDHFIIMDDVELTEIQDQAGLQLAGPKVSSVLDKHGFSHLVNDDLHLSEDRPHNLQFVSGANPLAPTCEIWSDETTIQALTTELALTARKATPTDLEHLRILSGTPLYGTDIRDKDLPQETAQDHRALHFAKGCYLGQEIVERIRSRGQVHRTFTGFLLTGDLPTQGTSLYAETLSSVAEPAEPAPAAAPRPIGELTSVARIGSTQIALGYIRREAIEKNLALHYPGGTATPTALPFQLPELRP